MDAETRHPKSPIRGIGLCLALGLTSCISLGRAEPPQEYYVLGADASPAAPAAPADSGGVTVGVRRLKLASYLASQSLVVRRGPNQVGFTEFRRWGEPLDAGINRVVAGGLVARGFREVAVAPWAIRKRFDYLVQLDVERFEGLAPGDSASTEGGVHLLATWEVIRPEDGFVLARGTTDHRRQGWTVGDYPGLVRMLDAGLDVLSADLAASIADIRSGQGPSPRQAEPPSRPR